MTPTKEEKKFFIEHHEFFETLWKPAFGDLVLLWDGDKAQWGKDLWCVIGRYSEDAVDVIRESDGAVGATLVVDCALLARPDQLREMLEKRANLSWVVGRVGDDYPDPRLDPDVKVYYASLLPVSEETIMKGPTPSIALGKCLLAEERKALKEKQHECE